MFLPASCFQHDKAAFQATSGVRKKMKRHSLSSIYAWEHLCRFDVLGISDFVCIWTDQTDSVPNGLSYNTRCDSTFLKILSGI